MTYLKTNASNICRSATAHEQLGMKRVHFISCERGSAYAPPSQLLERTECSELHEISIMLKNCTTGLNGPTAATRSTPEPLEFRLIDLSEMRDFLSAEIVHKYPDCAERRSQKFMSSLVSFDNLCISGWSLHCGTILLPFFILKWPGAIEYISTSNISQHRLRLHLHLTTSNLLSDFAAASSSVSPFPVSSSAPSPTSNCVP